MENAGKKMDVLVAAAFLLAACSFVLGSVFTIGALIWRVVHHHP